MHCLCTCFPKTVTVPVHSCIECDLKLCLLQDECLHFQNQTDIPQLKGECFSRESLKDELIISGFISMTCVLIVFAILKIYRNDFPQSYTRLVE